MRYLCHLLLAAGPPAWWMPPGGGRHLRMTELRSTSPGQTSIRSQNIFVELNICQIRIFNYLEGWYIYPTDFRGSHWLFTALIKKTFKRIPLHWTLWWFSPKPGDLMWKKSGFTLKCTCLIVKKKQPIFRLNYSEICRKWCTRHQV